jgi:hypothetical protein
MSEIFIIDHSLSTADAATSAGGVMFRYGNPRNCRADGPRRLFGQHNAHWIPAGHPGAGHILLFNNGAGRGGDRARSQCRCVAVRYRSSTSYHIHEHIPCLSF